MHSTKVEDRIIGKAAMRAINKILRENYGLRLNYSNNRRVVIRRKASNSYAINGTECVGVAYDWNIAEVLGNTGFLRDKIVGIAMSDGWVQGLEEFEAPEISAEHMAAIKQHLMVSKLSV